MKILLLCLFNKNILYDKMLEIQKSYNNSNNNIDIERYFIAFEETLCEDIKVIEDIIYIKGKETYINILYKTIKSLDYFINKLNKNYDYIIRSNISTIINFNNLFIYLSQLPKTNIYIGGNLEILRWQLQTYEICENKQEQRNSFYGLKYIQGIGIIFSYDVIKNLLEFSESFEYDIVDDVKLGLLIRNYLPEVYKNIDILPLAKVSYNNLENDSVFIRNRTYDRLLDVHNMRNIVNNIYNIKYPNYNKIIHITYKTLDKLENIKNQWLELNPEYKVKLYDNSKCLNFLELHYGKIYCDIFNYIQDGPIKSDFFRICVLYICGGIYVDADIKPLIPLNKYIEDDVDFVTCISYNYLKNNKTFNYNPHFIVTKKYNNFIYDTIKKYEFYYYSKKQYSYWHWSICQLFNIDISFNISIDNNIFIYNCKKYQFLIENAIVNNIYYNFTNIRDENNKIKFEYVNKCTCTYNGIDVFDNFTNKKFLN